MSERTEETALLPEDEARRMNLDDIVLVVDAQMPVRAKRIKYYEDRFFKETFDRQSGDFPYPSTSDQMRGLQGQIHALDQKIGSVQMSSGKKEKPARRSEIDALAAEDAGAEPQSVPAVEAYQDASARVDQFMERAADG
ncbi:Type IV secretory system Conjugative DNA transfer [Aliiroseovarius crassostreae]|nr:Type IV secretory system Conjugative DNA transfer [Aliiroseovarius crassostreae]